MKRITVNKKKIFLDYFYRKEIFRQTEIGRKHTYMILPVERTRVIKKSPPPLPRLKSTFNKLPNNLQEPRCKIFSFRIGYLHTLSLQLKLQSLRASYTQWSY